MMRQPRGLRSAPWLEDLLLPVYLTPEPTLSGGLPKNPFCLSFQACEALAPLLKHSPCILLAPGTWCPVCPTPAPWGWGPALQTRPLDLLSVSPAHHPQRLEEKRGFWRTP